MTNNGFVKSAFTSVYCLLFTINSFELKVNVLSGAFPSQNYNRLQLPNTQDATMIFLSLHILDMYDVSEAEMSYSVRFYFRQYWLDPRLKVNTHTDITSGQNKSRFLEKKC